MSVEGELLHSTKIEKERPFRVLSLDGGGMRGLYTASILKELSNRFDSEKGSKLDIGKGFDLIVGTSTGGILGCALASGVPIQKIIEFYRCKGPFIFSDPVPSSKLKKKLWIMRNLCSSANKNDLLKKSLDEIFGEETVLSVYKKRNIGLCICSVKVSDHRSRVFKTPHNPEKNADNGRKLSDVCIATSAAPIILPIGIIPNPEDSDARESYVDGGLWANNPIMVALTEALEITDINRSVEIISIGTCPPSSGTVVLPNKNKKGVEYWEGGVGALEMSMDAQSSGNQFIAQFIARYLNDKAGRKFTLLRLEQTPPSPDHSKFLGLDNASNEAIRVLTDLGRIDGQLAHSKSLNKKENYEIIKEIFSNLPEIEGKGDQK